MQNNYSRILKRIFVDSDKFVVSERFRGFTLIETLMYAGIVGGFITLFLLTAYQIIDFGDRLEKQRELGENQRFLVQKIHWVLSGATIVSPTAGDPPSSELTVNKAGVGQLQVFEESGAAKLQTGAAEAVSLSNDYAAVSNLQFEHLEFGNKNAIRATADLENNVATTSIDTIIIIN